jgi:hypothetical protein
MVRPVLLVMALLLAAVGEARADPILYSNGPTNGADGGSAINNGYSLSDSFSLAYVSNVTEVQLGLWAIAPPNTVQWSIGTTPFGTDKGSGTATLTSTFLNTNSSNDKVYASTFSLSQPLGSGTYWLTLQNAGASGSTFVYWDVNSGPSSAFAQSAAEGNSFASESFQIFGDGGRIAIFTIATPEPASIVLLGIGIAGLAGYGWRSRAKNRSRAAVV